jgi:hypothetical protein
MDGGSAFVGLPFANQHVSHRKKVPAATLLDDE